LIPGGDAEAHVAALAGLPGMSSARLSKLLDGIHPAQAWQSVKAGKHCADPGRRFRRSARATDVAEVAARYRRAGVRLLLRGESDYPSALLGDPTAPAVLFSTGEPAVLGSSAAVAIIGTRSATAYGRRVAAEIGVALAEEGVVVVSGLARGIDSAAHTGALRASSPAAARPAAVVGTGIDVVYPSSSADLWERVARGGVIVSESPLGTAPQPWVFPARNRIIADNLSQTLPVLIDMRRIVAHPIREIETSERSSADPADAAKKSVRKLRRIPRSEHRDRRGCGLACHAGCSRIRRYRILNLFGI